MLLPDSYEVLHQRAVESVNSEDLAPSIQQFQRLTERLLSLPPQVLERRPQLREILQDSALRWMTSLRWNGQSDEALAQIERLRTALPIMQRAWDIEEALGRIDKGDVSLGLDQLRGLQMQAGEGRNAVRILLAGELLAAGLEEESEITAQGAVRSAQSNEERLQALSFLVALETERNNPDAMVSYWQQAAKSVEAGTVNPLYERLAALGHWDRLDTLLASEKEGMLRRVFQGEIAHGRGDEARARELWEAVADDGYKVNTDSEAYSWIMAKILLGHGLDVQALAAGRYQNSMNESSALLMLVAAMAQAGRLDDARQILRSSLRVTYIQRPKWKAFPHSYWLRLLRFPLTDEAREALRPYFQTEEPQGAS